MKKLFCFVVCVLFCLSLAACSEPTVSQNAYDELQNNYDELKGEYDKLYEETQDWHSLSHEEKAIQKKLYDIHRDTQIVTLMAQATANMEYIPNILTLLEPAIVSAQIDTIMSEYKEHASILSNLHNKNNDQYYEEYINSAEKLISNNQAFCEQFEGFIANVMNLNSEQEMIATLIEDYQEEVFKPSLDLFTENAEDSTAARDAYLSNRGLTEKDVLSWEDAYGKAKDILEKEMQRIADEQAEQAAAEQAAAEQAAAEQAAAEQAAAEQAAAEQAAAEQAAAEQAAAEQAAAEQAAAEQAAAEQAAAEQAAAEQAAIEQVAAEQQNTAQYVLNTSTKKFHKPGCSSAKQIKPANYSTIGSREAAISSGYSPCGRCKP